MVVVVVVVVVVMVGIVVGVGGRKVVGTAGRAAQGRLRLQPGQAEGEEEEEATGSSKTGHRTRCRQDRGSESFQTDWAQLDDAVVVRLALTLRIVEKCDSSMIRCTQTGDRIEADSS
ncbi:unnamed protein product [Protopolystoma xenopodis]|uniref:Uncharacterized protein n=1 Tax=Protopolystoma xenopodis TaxID=117903 RepID=A0A448WQ54_9PLAT|nr:unnamed protein product [Protopolystoma xenopodis]